VWPVGKEAVIADNYEGKPFGRPNDIVADRNGGLYFTDISPDKTVIPSAVYFVPPGGAPIRVAEGITTPNGLQLSHDEKTLYVNDTGGINIYAFDVQPDGRLANRRVFASYVGRDQTLPPGAPPSSNADGLVTDGRSTCGTCSPEWIRFRRRVSCSIRSRPGNSSTAAASIPRRSSSAGSMNTPKCQQRVSVPVMM
jgi:hypothetical protein